MCAGVVIASLLNLTSKQNSLKSFMTKRHTEIGLLVLLQMYSTEEGIEHARFVSEARRASLPSPSERARRFSRNLGFTNHLGTVEMDYSLSCLPLQQL